MICSRVLDLVNQLLSDTPEAHNAISVWRLRYRKAAIGRHLCDGVAHVVPLLCLVVSEQATSALSRAFQQVACTSAHTQLVILVILPAELVHEDTQHQGTIHAAAGDDDVAALGERRGDGFGTEVHVRTHELDIRDLLACEHLAEALPPKLRDPVGDVVAHDASNLEVNLGLSAHHLQCVAAAQRVHAASIAYDFDALGLDLLGIVSQHCRDAQGEAHARILLPLLGQDRHRRLGKVVADEVATVPLVDKLLRRHVDVAPHRAVAADADGKGRSHGTSPARGCQEMGQKGMD
mmetsp:Transcript_55497/g.180002  ORF Transcript_55497/g.180002 Transcript_55497/m.180002 type:complete len:292 (-) Transcript_55497:17-892(-)